MNAEQAAARNALRAFVRLDVGRETVHVHSGAVHVPVHEDINGTRPRET